MSTEMIFSRVDGDAISEAELSRELAEGLGIPLSDVQHEPAEQLVLGETGITVWLDLDENGNPMVATARISINAKAEDVSRLCKSFQAIGWML